MNMLGEKLLIKLWGSIVDKGIGGLLTPWQTLRTEKAKTDARARDLIVLAEAERQAKGIRSGKIKVINDKGIPILIDIPSQDDSNPIVETNTGLNEGAVLEHVLAQEKADSLRKEVNITRAVLHAEERLSGDASEPVEEGINEDWLYRWKEYASNVGVDDLQQLWGAVLAGETKEPGTYNLRTLDFLRNLSKKEAELIEKCGKFSISGIIASEEKDILESHGLDFGAMLKLQELGIVQGADSTVMVMEYSSVLENMFQRVLVSNDLALLITHEDQNKKFTVPSCGITDLGKQVAKLGKFGGNKQYLLSIGRKLVKQGFDVEIGDWHSLEENKGNILNQIRIEETNA